MPPTHEPTRIFSGEWLENTAASCSHRYRVGYSGVPAGRWNGWQIFRVTPPVMAALIDDHHADMTALIDESAAAGRPLDQAWLDAQHHLASLAWLGRLVVVDHRIRQNDPTAVEVITPDRHGRYQVGFGWSWDAVDPADVHTIHHNRAAAVPTRSGGPDGRSTTVTDRRQG
jgi:hypothetical protein